MSTDTTPSESTSGSTPTYAPSSSATSFIDVSGGLLTEQTIQSLRQERFDHPAATPETFSLPDEEPQTNTALEEEIALTWEQLVERWDEVTQKGELFEMDVSDARNKWILKLFRALDFEPVYQRALLSVSDLEFDLSHKGWPDEDIADYGEMAGARAPVLHTVEPPSGREIDLDSKPSSRGNRSPHDELQKFLNANPEQDWGIVTDGVHLRVLRDFYHTYTRGYVEFDLENIFESRNYQDFRALYRLCHASRFLPIDEGESSRNTGEVVDEAEETDEADDVAIPLEMLYQTSLATGVKVGQDLQENVISTIETLGNGLLNPDIREFLREGGEAEAEEYYQEVLFVVYRLLFLLYAEQRGMMPGRDSLYTEEYSITALRERAERRRDTDDPNTDLWHGLQATFRLVEEGNDEMGVPCYNGMLFDSERLNHLPESACPNDALLSAVADLTLIEREGVLQRISYADLGVEEIGSVYESLLEFTPRLAEEHVDLDDRTVPPGQFYLDDRGTTRKETGSYYTDPGLVHELIESALIPVIDDRLESAPDDPDAQEAALLDISVCDPACGSAAFLVAANNRLAKRLARIRTGMEYPLDEVVREARRDVLQNCIYGVDMNPMAVELAKVSLWINSAVDDKPLNFLDHHIKCGNSLIGTNGELLEDEFPEDAYDTTGGRDWHVGNDIRKRVRQENNDRARGSDNVSIQQYGIDREEFITLSTEIESIGEEDTSGVEEKRQLYEELRGTEAFQREKLAYDIWTAAFYWPMDGSASEYPTPSTIEKTRRNPHTDDPALLDLKERAAKIAEQQRFFHWELEFAEVFNGTDPGFDCVLGNPPWDKVKVEEREWFAGKIDEIAESGSKGHRTRLINDLEESNPELYDQWQQASEAASSTSKYIRESGRFPLSGNGEINTYPVFTELAGIEMVNSIGRAGMVVKTGIATDYRTQDLFGQLVSDNRLVSLHDFVNQEGLFPDVAPPERFCLLTLTGENWPIEAISFSFFSTNLDMMRNEDRRYTLTKKEIEGINPNTKSCPTFENTAIRDIAVDIYSSYPVLINENDQRNPWGITYHTLYHMTNDTDAFEDNTFESLQEEGYSLDDNNVFQKDGQRYLPLYEAKFIHQFDHRFGSFAEIPEENRFVRKAQTKRVSSQEKKDPYCEVLPRYWVDESEFQDRTEGIDWSDDWIFSFRGITNTTTNFRTAMGAVVPHFGFGNSAPVLTFEDRESKHEDALLFTSFFTSFVFDFVLRQSVGGANLNLYILKQLPMPTPNQISNMEVNIENETNSLRNFLVRHSLQLTWTSHSLDLFGENIAPGEGPFVWDDGDRRERRAKIDAAIAHIYGLTRDEFEYVMDRFDILKQREIDELGEYRRKRECLESYDKMEVNIY